jgi:predicted small secreted protein
MKTAHLTLVLIPVCISLASCRGAGGPAQRVGYEMDRAAYKVGGGIARAGHTIQRAAR